MRSISLMLPALAAVTLAGCGSSDPGPPVGSAVPKPQRPFAVDAAAGVLSCLRSAHIPARRVSVQVIQVGPPAEGMRIVVAQTAGQAQLDQLQGRAEGAEIVDRLEFFTGRGSEGEIEAIEGCVNAHGSDTA